MDSFMTFMGEQVKDQQHATEFMEMLNNLDLTSFKISKKKQPNARCCARLGRKGTQCTSKSKDGVDFCGHHGAYDEPKRCARCSQNGEDVFHANKWDHSGRIDEPVPTRAEKVKKAKKPKRDPSKPKRGLNKYMAFTKAMRVEVTKANSEMSPKDVTRELGKQWRERSDEDKIPYVKVAEENKEEYKRAMVVWETAQKAKAAEAEAAETKNVLMDVDDSMPGNERVIAMLRIVTAE